MKYFLYIFYRYYKIGKHTISDAYNTTVLNMAFSILIYIGSAYLLIYPDTNLFYKNTIYFWIFGDVALFYFLIRIFIKEKDLQNPEFEEKYKKFHGFLAVLYVVMAIGLMVFAGLNRKAVLECSKNDVEVIDEEVPTIDQSELREKEPETNRAQ